jgi:DNA-binding transcriptional LysR family regulator
LAEADWLLREAGSGTRDHLEHALAVHGISPRVTLSLEQPEALRQCVALGMGIGCLSELDLREAFAQGTLVPLTAPDLQLSRQLQIVLHAQKHLTRGIRAVLELCEVALPD